MTQNITEDLTQRSPSATWQSLAACGAFTIAFLGVLHEVIGPTLFPWAPDVFGFFFWHLIGATAILLGVSLLCGVLGLVRLPVVPVAIAASIGGVAAMTFFAVYKQAFHFPALCLVLAGILAAVCYRKAQRP